ncbi:ABC transporter permease [Tepidanaerobacter sp. GT38]|uniref:ABC transporter permease n=1 Tax=Tepidanaerobacter sp. GT38 TaxID=2722793 RepID=UPI001F17A60C|nr:ABC transporter permease [Tepidanaerobacter sp. GT38]MCG1011592.1 ABC transporter permease [Tepidanaerobacter sp. GT38]
MKHNAIRFLLKYARFMILIILLIALSLLSPAFLTFTNIANVLGQASLLIIVSYGMTLAIVTKGIDLSIGSVLALSSCIAASIIKSQSIILGIIIGLLIGLLCGSINGIMITKIGLTPFIATYGMDWIARGLAYVYMGGTQIYGFDKAFRFFGSGQIMGIPVLVFEVIFITVVLCFLTYKTTYGRNIYATGSNIKATRLAGVNTDRMVISVFALNGLLAAIAGLLYISRLNAAEALIGTDFTLNSIAATLIGGTPFGGGEGGVARTVMGAIIMTLLINGMNLLEISSYWQTATVGFVILLSLFIENTSKNFLV